MSEVVMCSLECPKARLSLNFLDLIYIKTSSIQTGNEIWIKYMIFFFKKLRMGLETTFSLLSKNKDTANSE